MTWKPKAGEYCRTRSGRKAFVSALLSNPFGRDVIWPLVGFVDREDTDELTWKSDGSFYDKESEYDLVGPWTDPIDVPVTVSIDSLHNTICGSGHCIPNRTDIVGFKHATIRVCPGDRG